MATCVSMEDERFPIIDIDCWDDEMIGFLTGRSDRNKVESVYSWIPAFIVRNIKSGLLDIALPIARRVLHVMEQGMSGYQQFGSNKYCDGHYASMFLGLQRVMG